MKLTSTSPPFAPGQNSRVLISHLATCLVAVAVATSCADHQAAEPVSTPPSSRSNTLPLNVAKMASLNRYQDGGALPRRRT